MGKEHVHFNVCLGNPPYQIEDSGNGKSAKPVYNLFVEEAKKLSTDAFSFIMPARWYSGGKGLDQFRQSMLNDPHFSKLIDYENYREVFPGLGGLAGGVCTFVWKANHNGPCRVINVKQGQETELVRPLNEFDTFIRQNQALEIVRKVNEATASLPKLSARISSRKPFGLPTNYKPVKTGTPCWFAQRIGKQFAKTSDIEDSNDYLQKWKFLIPRAPIAGQTDFSKPVGFYYDGNTRIAAPGEACTETYLVAGAFDTDQEAQNFKSYLFTKTVRFLLLQTVVSQDVTKKNYCFVPDPMDFSKPYSDQLLVEQWGLSQKDWEYIDSRIASEMGGN